MREGRKRIASAASSRSRPARNRSRTAAREVALALGRLGGAFERGRVVADLAGEAQGPPGADAAARRATTRAVNQADPPSTSSDRITHTAGEPPGTPPPKPATRSANRRQRLREHLEQRAQRLRRGTALEAALVEDRLGVGTSACGVRRFRGAAARERAKACVELAAASPRQCRAQVHGATVDAVDGAEPLQRGRVGGRARRQLAHLRARGALRGRGAG